ncbi:MULTISPECIES: serine/threonine-protein kinase [unclassified Blastococcus]
MTAPSRAVPPEIPGFVDGRPLGSGGFAEVFLYRELMPERDVAVKVLGERLGDDASRRQFVAEANLMASVAKHPAVLDIYRYAVTGDGRPFIVMPYCSRSDLAQQVRRQPLSVPEALSIGIRMAGAVETAHQLGILHRDIKPANILVTDAGDPALTDFGISATLHDSAGIEGLSVPWSPPEVLDDPACSSRQSDVYSLAATVWHLLAGHSPFVVPGGQNDVPTLVRRITEDPVPPIGRGDVPPRLERLLARAMAKDPALRPATAQELGRDLQAIEGEEGYAETPLRVLPAPAGRTAPSAAAVPRPAVVPDADASPTIGPGTSRTPGWTAPPPATPPPLAPAPAFAPPGTPAAAPAEERTQDRSGQPPVEQTVHRPAVPAPEPPAAEPERRRGRLGAVLVALAAAVVAAGVVLAVVLGGSDEEPASPEQTATAAPTPLAAVVPTPERLAGVRQPDGTVLFTWTNPEPADGDLWLVRRVDTAAPTVERVGDPALVVSGLPAGQQACIEVSLVRADGRASVTPARGCAG